jgi:NAD(P)-dependent dehydrogenase (short-subunit alcohol dehydrogenase family)
MAVNVTAPVKLMREIVPVMRAQQHGVIVNMASRAGLSGAAAGVAYTASTCPPFGSPCGDCLTDILCSSPCCELGKHALIGVTKNVAWRFRDDNIRCNAVCPGGMLRLHGP